MGNGIGSASNLFDPSMSGPGKTYVPGAGWVYAGQQIPFVGNPSSNGGSGMYTPSPAPVAAPTPAPTSYAPPPPSSFSTQSRPLSSYVSQVSTGGMAAAPQQSGISGAGQPLIDPMSFMPKPQQGGGMPPPMPQGGGMPAMPMVPNGSGGVMAASPAQAGGGMARGGVPNGAAGRDKFHAGGLLHGAAGGRTDTLNRTVPADSYVIPADVVSSLGQGNTASGGLILEQMFPGGRAAAMAHGGAAQAVPVVLAGGEYVCPPSAIVRKFGDLKHGHASLDAFVKHIRAKTVKTLKTLPGPKK